MILLNPISTILSLVLTGLNIVEFFLVIRMVMLWRELEWLKPFMVMGKGLTDQSVAIVNKFTHKLARRVMSVKGSLIVSVMVLELFKLFIAVVF